MPSYFLAPSLMQLRNEINALWPKRDKSSDGWVGDTAHAARKSDHNPDWDNGGIIRAIDIDEDGIDAERVLRHIMRDFRTNYVIYEGKIYQRVNDFAARNYIGANAHTKHIHVSIMHGVKYENSAITWIPVAADEPPDVIEMEPDMLLILSPKLGGALVSGGWYRQLQSMTDVESFEAAGLLRKNINDEQHAIIRDNCLNASRLDSGLAPTLWGYTFDKVGDDGPAPVKNFIQSILTNIRVLQNRPFGDIKVERLSDTDVERVVDGLAKRLAK